MLQSTYKGIYLAEYREFVVRQQPVGLVQKEVSPDELFEAPIFTLDEPVSTLALWKNKTRKSRSSRVSLQLRVMIRGLPRRGSTFVVGKIINRVSRALGSENL